MLARFKETTMPAPTNERRMVEGRIEIRAEGDEPSRLTGHAAVFNEEANIGGWFIERIAPGAFAKSISRGDDVRALWNHDPSAVLGRTRNGTLTLREDERGLHVEIYPPDTQLGRDVVTLVKRGDVSQMSFGFRVVAEKWEDRDGTEVRTILEADLFDVSPVTFPAYEGTSISARSSREVVERRRAEREREQQRQEQVNLSAIQAEQQRMAMRLRLAELGQGGPNGET